MVLDERKCKILKTVVNEYVRSGIPVGSKAILELTDIKSSSATIRADMATLEKLGYLEQPHTSAGRVPTYAGYKFYIDMLLDTQNLPQSNVPKEPPLNIEEVGTALAELTGQTVIYKNTPKFSVISRVEVIPTGKRVYVVLLITDGGNVKNKVCRTEFDITDSEIQEFKELINSDDENIAIALKAYSKTLEPLIDAYNALKTSLKEDVVVINEKNLLLNPEIERKEAVRLLEQKNYLKGILDENFKDINVVFGENGSAIISKGNIGIVGSVRIDYEKIISALKTYTDLLEVQNNDGEE
ncbi:MAG: heat-inducible transcription repressor HrcA [Ruminococcus sp.]|jgi:heat-inducible transcriptional repressor|nr:heat-inducible transcription repressor HrcA [Ruminococcus sp.]